MIKGRWRRGKWREQEWIDKGVSMIKNVERRGVEGGRGGGGGEGRKGRNESVLELKVCMVERRRVVVWRCMEVCEGEWWCMEVCERVWRCTEVCGCT